MALLALSPVPGKHIGQTVVDTRLISQQHHLAIDLMTDLTAVQAAHRRPHFPAHLDQGNLGVNSSAGGVPQPRFPGDYAVMARHEDPAANGGVNAAPVNTGAQLENNGVE